MKLRYLKHRGSLENRISRQEQRQRIPDPTWNRFVCRKDSFDATGRQFSHPAHQTPPPKAAAMRLNRKGHQLPAKLKGCRSTDFQQ